VRLNLNTTLQIFHSAVLNLLCVCVLNSLLKNQEGWYSGYALDMYSGGTQFESQDSLSSIVITVLCGFF
jgi:hypothetical protein